jgi:hypothetical protein
MKRILSSELSGTLCLSLALLAFQHPAAAEDQVASDTHNASGHAEAAGHGEGTESAHGEGHEFHKNILAVFGGVTHSGRRENDPALALEYERRFTEHFSMGAFAEYTFGDSDYAVYGIPFYYRSGHWRFALAPGIEDSKEHGTEELVRISANYIFEVGGGWDVAPTLAVDFVDGEDVWIFGLGVGKGF